MLHEAAYGEDSPLGGSLYAYNLNKLTAEDIMQYRSHNYNANNVTGKTDTVTIAHATSCLVYLYL